MRTYLYRYKDDFIYSEEEIFVEYEFEKCRLLVTYLSGERWYRIHFRRKSVNNTFSPAGFSYAPALTSNGIIVPLERAQWSETEVESDYHSPISFRSVLDSDVVAEGTGVTPGERISIYKSGVYKASATADAKGRWQVNVKEFAVVGDRLEVAIGKGTRVGSRAREPRRAYTSGSHGAFTFEDTSPTAHNVQLSIYIDGQEFDADKNIAVKAKTLTITGVNEVFAYNTVVSGRAVLSQYFSYTVSRYGLWVHAKHVVKDGERIRVYADNGCQVYLAGFTPITANTFLFWGGQTSQRQRMVAQIFDSGSKREFPACLGISIRHPVAGELSSWMDLSFGVGDRRYLEEGDVLFRHPRPKSAKIYPSLFGMPDGVEFGAGEGYEWRGGYYWGVPTAGDGFDTRLRLESGYLKVKRDGTYELRAAG